MLKWWNSQDYFTYCTPFLFTYAQKIKKKGIPHVYLDGWSPQGSILKQLRLYGGWSFPDVRAYNIGIDWISCTSHFMDGSHDQYFIPHIIAKFLTLTILTSQIHVKPFTNINLESAAKDAKSYGITSSILLTLKSNHFQNRVSHKGIL